MEQLSTALNITPTAERAAAYWDALCDLRLEDVLFACKHAARHWRPKKRERVFPLPARLRAYALENRDARVQLTRTQTHARPRADERHQLPERTETVDELGLQAIHTILAMLEKNMDMARVVPKTRPTGSDDVLAYRPSEPADAARDRLRDQFRRLEQEEDPL